MKEEQYNIKISIVTVCFNSAKTIEKTIKSVLGQDYDNIEYIIIDGNSTDGTQEIIRKYEDKIAYWVSEPDNGIYDAMNKGIQAATGELIAFMNSGDWYEDGAISAVVEKYICTHADVLYGDVYKGHGDIKRLWSMQNINMDELHWHMIFCHQGIFVKTEIQKMYGFDACYQIAADYDFFLKIFIAEKQFQYVNKVIAFCEDSGISSSNSIGTFREMRSIALRALNLYPLSKRDRYKKCIEQFYRKADYAKLNSYICKRILSGRYTLSDEAKHIASQKPIVIFGVCDMGDLCARCLRKLDIQVCCMTDNDVKKQGGTYLGIPVIAPKELIELKGTAVVLIAAYAYSDDIAEQLNQMGLEERSDYYRFKDWVCWAAANRTLVKPN